MLQHRISSKLFSFGMASLQSGKIKRAEKLGKLLYSRKFTGGEELLARVAIEQEEYQNASGILVEAVRKSPQIPIFWSLRGQVHSDLGEFQEALRCFKEYMNLIDKNEDEGFGLYNLAVTYGRMGKFEEGRKALQEIADADTGPSKIRDYMLAEYFLEDGLVDEARSTLKLVNESENDDIAKSLEAWCLFLKGDTDNAKNLIDDVREKDSADRVFLQVISLINGLDYSGHKQYHLIVTADLENNEFDGWVSTFWVVADDIDEALKFVNMVLPTKWQGDLSAEIKHEQEAEKTFKKGVIARRTGYTFFSEM